MKSALRRGHLDRFEPPMSRYRLELPELCRKNARRDHRWREWLIIDAMTRGDRLLRAVLLVLAAEVVVLGIAMLPDPRQGSARTSALLGVILLTLIGSALLLLLKRPF